MQKRAVNLLLFTLVFLLLVSVVSAVWYDPSTWFNGATTITGNAVGGGITGNAVAVTDYTNGLVAHWKFDETAYSSGGANQVRDDLGSSHGTVMASQSYPTIFPTVSSGLKGNAVKFNGVNGEKILINPIISSTFNLNKFTLSAWIKTDDAGTGRRRVFSQQTGPYYGMALNGNNLECFSSFDLGVVQFNGLLNDGQWHHIACVRNSGLEFAFYIDGVRVKTSSLVGRTTATYSMNNQAVSIGVYLGANSETFNGTIDELRIYNNALTNSQISQVYNSNKPGSEVTPTGTVTQILGYECVDSDGNNNLNAGNVTLKQIALFTNGQSGYGPSAIHPDVCTSASNLREITCASSSSAVPTFNTVACANGCSNGACNPAPGSSCTDSDVNATYPDGKNYGLKGQTTVSLTGNPPSVEADFCNYGTPSPSPNYVQEFSCTNGVSNSVSEYCPYGCVDGACLPVSSVRTVQLNEWVNRSEFIQINATHKMRVTYIQNMSSGFDSDEVEFVLYTLAGTRVNPGTFPQYYSPGTFYRSTTTAEGIGRVTIGGIQYALEYRGAAISSAEYARQVRLTLAPTVNLINVSVRIYDNKTNVNFSGGVNLAPYGVNMYNSTFFKQCTGPTSSNFAGIYFNCTNIPAGDYTLKAHARGFRNYTFSGRFDALNNHAVSVNAGLDRLPPPVICTDTDGGVNLTVRGSVNGYYPGGSNLVTQSDECSGTVLIEWSCGNFSVTSDYIAHDSYPCSVGCSNGACLPPVYNKVFRVIDANTFNPLSGVAVSIGNSLNSLKFDSVKGEYYIDSGLLYQTLTNSSGYVNFTLPALTGDFYVFLVGNATKPIVTQGRGGYSGSFVVPPSPELTTVQVLLLPTVKTVQIGEWANVGDSINLGLGRVLKINSIINTSSGFSGDRVVFEESVSSVVINSIVSVVPAFEGKAQDYSFGDSHYNIEYHGVSGSNSNPLQARLILIDCTSFTYSAWEACSSSGLQTRTVLTSSPSGCAGGRPVLNQVCTYVPPVSTPIANSTFLYYIKNQSGASIPGVQYNLKNSTGGVFDDNCIFDVSSGLMCVNLFAGNYLLNVSAPNYFSQVSSLSLTQNYRGPNYPNNIITLSRVNAFSVCGNGACESGENSASCLIDCPAFTIVCGNDLCETGESSSNCLQDCPITITNTIGPNAAGCSDTDANAANPGGVNYAVRGTFNAPAESAWTAAQRTDYCVSETKLAEYSCDPAPAGYDYNGVEVDCPGGCVDGTCPSLSSPVVAQLDSGTCGNGIVESEEGCDNGAENGVACTIAGDSGSCTYCGSNCQTEFKSQTGSGEVTITTPSACTDGCSLESGQCVPLGYRVSGKYCDVSKALVSYKADSAVCENNFECGSNLCVSGQCLEAGFFQRITDWFSKLFATSSAS